MPTAVLRLPKEVKRSPAFNPFSSPSPKPSMGIPRLQPFPSPSREKTPVRRNSSLRRQPDSPIMTKKQNRSNKLKSDSRDLVMEEVKILKRGESLRPLSPPSSPSCVMEDFMTCLTDQLGPDPMALPKPRGSAYAGPAFISSPSPNSLPVPLFLEKSPSRGEDVATRSLRNDRRGESKAQQYEQKLEELMDLMHKHKYSIIGNHKIFLRKPKGSFYRHLTCIEQDGALHMVYPKWC